MTRAALNDQWCQWLRSLLPSDKSLVYADELYYFDEWHAERMTFTEILNDARSFAPEYEELLAQ